MQTVRCVLIGDSDVGKTCLLKSHRKSKFEETTDKGLEKHEITVKLNGKNGKETNLVLIDTDGQDGFEEYRQYTYKTANVILMCFALNSYKSLQNIEQHWYPEVNDLSLGIPIILLGTKEDLRKSTLKEPHFSDDFVTTKKGLYVATKLKCMKYFECSATNVKEIDSLFRDLVKEVLSPKENPCCILM